jgi:hypothetical protein
METCKAATDAANGQLDRSRARPVWCDTDRAADYIGSASKTLEHWRRVGGGPRYAKAGRRCLYRYDWLDEWLESRTVTSTAEARRAGIL